MPDRAARIGAFLQVVGWGGARREPLAGDASNRRYWRLHRPDGAGAILMDAPPERGEDTRPFVAIARHLAGLGLSPPRILAEDAAAGLLLLEDLGDALLARLLDRDPSRAGDLYAAATDTLIALQRHPPPPGLAAYGPEKLGDLAALALDWYAPAITAAPAPDGARAAFAAQLGAMAARLAPGAPVLALRDYHCENLIWLPARTGPARIGLLDFQDALAGHPAYDLVSLLQDARRDVPETLEAQMRRRFLDATGHPAQDFAAAYAFLGAQRNLRILGVFARLALRDGKPGYLAMMPRVWRYLMRDLAHPDLAPLAERVEAALPAPTPARLERIKAQCPTARTP